MNKLLIVLLLVSSSVFSHEKLITDYLTGYVKGDVDAMPFDKTATVYGLPSQTITTYTDKPLVYDAYTLFFLSSKERHLEFRNIRWNDTRITADFYAVTDGNRTYGSTTMIIDKDEHIVGIYNSNIVYEESESKIADAGQIADKGSTAIALATRTGVEANPLLAGLNPAGMLALGGGMVALRKSRTQGSLDECISISKGFGGFGWGAAGNNLAVLFGLGPIGIPLGLATGITTYHQNYKGDCVDGPVRIAKISR